jgi:hypothetical protein
MRRADIFGSAGLLILGLVVLFVVIPAEAEGDTWSGVSPLFFPTIVAAGFTLACAGMLLQAILQPKPYEGRAMPMTGRDFAFFLLACAIILGAVFVIHRFGLLWGGPLLVAALMLFMGERNWLRIGPMAVVPVLIFAFFITKVLNAPLP